MTKTILITGAGSGFGEAAAIGLAQAGHTVIATAQFSPQVTPLREKAKAAGLGKLSVMKLDLLDPFDVAYAQRLAGEVDVLWNNAGIGEAGPVFEIPMDLVRRNFETNLFAPLALTQGFVKAWIGAGKKAKVVFTSSMGGLFTPANWGVYVATKHALESVAEAMQQELAAYGIKVQTINPGAFYTGYNETMADTPFRWLDDKANITQRAALRQEFDTFLAAPDGHLDAQEMIDRMIAIVPADTGKFRNVVPKATEDMLKAHQLAAWDNPI
jgi:NAD(P)-dependent dehydrogenase (short-subunit alcohol dehydrogenase family)